MPYIERFRADFAKSMEQVRQRLAELERAGAVLHLRVGEFCARP